MIRGHQSCDCVAYKEASDSQHPQAAKLVVWNTVASSITSMKVEQVLHMVGGAGDTSYSSNSKLQETAILLTKPILKSAIEEIMISKKLQYEKMIFVDLGCSSGSNALSFVTQVLDILGEQYQRLGRNPTEVQFCLNDLPGNDFNYLFQIMEDFKEKRRELFVPYYVIGVPGSFYRRLFPSSTVNLFHSSYSLQWLSQVPEGLENEQGIPLNKRNINITHTSPYKVVKAYQKQFERDFSAFLKYRYVELSIGGEMVLKFLGREAGDPADGELSCLWGLLADALNLMVLKGRIAQDKVDTFEVPVYGPSMQELKSIICAEGLFELKQEKMFKSNWDPFADSMDGNGINDLAKSGKNVAMCIRAVTEPLISYQFGEAILDELFKIFADNVTRHFQEGQAMYTVIVVVLKKKA